MPPIAGTVFRRRLLLCGILLAALTGCAEPRSAPAPVEDVLRLAPDDLDEPLPLPEGWAARTGIEDPLHRALDPDGWKPVDIRQSFRQQGFPDEGSVSYRLAVRFPEGVRVFGAVRHVHNAFRLWAVLPSGERHLLAQSGHVSDVPGEIALSRRPAVFAFPEAREQVLVWQISNAGYAHGGPFHPMHIGTEHAIQTATIWHVMAAAVLVGFFAALALGALLLWMQDLHEPAALAIGLLAVLAGVQALAQSGLLESLYEPSFTFLARALLEMGTVLLLPGGMAFLLWTVMPWAFAPLRTPWGALAPLERAPLLELGPQAPHRTLPITLRRVNTYAAGFALAASLLLTLVALLAPLSLVGRIFAFSFVATVPLLSVLVLLAVEAAFVRPPLWAAFALGFLCVAATGAHDLAVAMGLDLPLVFWLPYGYAAFFVLFCTAFVTLKVRAKRLTDQANEELVRQIQARSKELQIASQAAQAAYLARSQFLTAVSHELRTPLAAIMGYAHLLDEELDANVSPQHHEFLRAISQSGERLLHLIDDLLELSRIEAGRFVLRPGPVDANVLVREVHLQLYPLAREKELTFEVESEIDDGAATFIADGTRLRQVLVNLVSNAIKFTSEGGVRIVVDEAVLDDHPAFRFSVEDTGVGISTEFMPHLFARFTQEARAYGQAQRGTGLGLHLSKELIERMGGTIEVESTVGVGSVFAVTLPVRVQTEAPV